MALARIADYLRPRIATFAREVETVHFVAHSMGGLVVRALLAHDRPGNMGRVIMLGTPHGGSELADLIYRLRLDRPILNRAGAVLRTRRGAEIEKSLGKVDYPLGVIAGDRPVSGLLTDRIFRAAHDGKVSVAATHAAGQADHRVMPVAHTAMLYSRPVADQILHFLQHGEFDSD